MNFKNIGMIIFCLFLFIGIYIGFKFGKKSGLEYAKKNIISYRQSRIDEMVEDKNRIMESEKLSPSSELITKDKLVEYRTRKVELKDISKGNLLQMDRKMERDREINIRTNNGIVGNEKKAKTRVGKREYYQGFEE